MTITIQISEETKKKLFMVRIRLEKKWGRRLTYYKVIKFLLQEEKGEINKQDFLDNVKKYHGILKLGEGKTLLKFYDSFIIEIIDFFNFGKSTLITSQVSSKSTPKY